MNFIQFFCLFIMALFYSDMVKAQAPANLTVQGRILKPDGSYLSAPSVIFNIKVVSPGTEACILYEENQVITNLAATQGNFSIAIGSGVRVGDDTGLSLATIFKNSGTLAGLACNSGTTYPSASGHSRKVKISFDDGSGAGVQSLASDYSLSSTAFAFYADDAAKLNGVAANKYFSLSGISNFTPLTDLEYGKFQDLISGTSTQYISATPSTVSASASVTSPIVSGSTASSQDITIISTTHMNKGNILLAPTGGNVGIGTTTPSTKLHMLTNDSTIYTSALMSQSPSDVMTLANEDQTPNGYTGLMFQHKSSNVALGRIALTGSFFDANMAALTFGLRGMSGGAGAVERMRIQADGNVGIGTSSAEQSFDVLGVNMQFRKTGDDPKIYIRRQDTSIADGNVLGEINFTGDDASAVNTRGVSIFAHATSNWASGTTPAALVFQTTPSGSEIPVERMSIRSDGDIRLALNGGNVGIGTSTPVSKLHVSTTSSADYSTIANLSNTSTTGWSNLQLANDAFAQGAWIGLPGSANAYSNVRNRLMVMGWADGVNIMGANDVRMYTGGWTHTGYERMRIDVNGNIGIGTITPQAKLDVAGLIKLPRQPAAATPTCNASGDGSIAITNAHVGCVCNGVSWVRLADGVTACTF